jgi:hypothetical protein
MISRVGIVGSNHRAVRLCINPIFWEFPDPVIAFFTQSANGTLTFRKKIRRLGRFASRVSMGFRRRIGPDRGPAAGMNIFVARGQTLVTREFAARSGSFRPEHCPIGRTG